MLDDFERSSCRSLEFPLVNETDGCHSTPEGRSYTRYRILFYKKELSLSRDKGALSWIKILDLSGDIDSFSQDKQSDSHDGNATATNVDKSGPGQRPAESQTVSFDSRPIENCFKRKEELPEDNTPKTEGDGSRIWGKIKGDLRAFISGKPGGSAGKGQSVYLTVGPYVLRGKEVDFRDAENYVVLRKVPDHCACVCSDSEAEPDTHLSHPAYYEICGVINQKLDFKDRPIFYQSTEDWGAEEYQIYMPNCTSENWFVMKVDRDTLDDILREQAYFKIVSEDELGRSKKAVLCILNKTYYIERIELGGTFLLVFSMAQVAEGAEGGDLLVMAGSSKYAYNLIRSNPVFESLPRMDNVHISALLNQTLISDLELADFVLGKYEQYPSYYLYQLNDTLRYMGQYFFGEFAVRVIQVIPIYFSNHPDKKKPVFELSVGDVWAMVNEYTYIFDFIPPELLSVGTVFQALLKVSDVEQTFETLEQYLAVMRSPAAYEFKFRLNLFKIQKLIGWCVVSANYHREVGYYHYAYYVDSILFNKAVPSYVFDELIGYMAGLESDDPQVLDYLKCIAFYYNKLTFTDVSNLLSVSESTGLFENKTLTVFDKTGTNLFAIEDLEFKFADLHRLPCLSYDVFKTNTRGLTQLRFSYSMNSLLSICRCPLSLHIAFLSEKTVSVLDSSRCVIRIYPTVRHETLRATLSEMFRLKNTWRLEVLEHKLRSFFKEKPAIDTLTGAPDHHGRLWITKETNGQNYRNKNTPTELTYEAVSSWQNSVMDLKHVKEESYIIINWNVPV